MNERLYTDLASWWPLLSPPEEYDEEAVGFLMKLQAALGRAPTTLLELGSGGGHLASHFPDQIEVVLLDRSEAMLEVSRALNPEREHVCADMTSVRLGRTFDTVLIHDAVMYLHTEVELRAALATSAAHLIPGGVALFVPDHVRETFEPGISIGGVDRGDRGARLMEWRHDPDPDDDCYTVDFSFMLRTGGEVEVVHDRHRMGMFSLAVWDTAIRDAGLELMDAEEGFLVRKAGAA